MTTIRRVLMTADTTGGVWTYALDLCRGLSAHGVKVLLAVMGPDLAPCKRAEAQALDNVKLVHGAFALEWMREPWRDVERAGTWLETLARLWQPDVCHLNGFAHAACDFQAPVLIAAHACVFSWWRAVRGGAPGGEWREYRDVVARGVAAADAVVAPSRWMLDQVAQSYGVPRAAAVVAHARRRDLFRVGHKRSLMFGAGRAWDEAKNFSVLDTAAAALSWPVAIAGPVEHRGERAPSFRHCRSLGELRPEEVAAWMARSAIFVAPAKYQPFGLAVLEAALSGCALVLSDIPSFRETWADAALFVDPNEPRAWQHALDHLIARPRLVSALAERALRHAGNYPLQSQVDAYLELYRVLGQRRTACAS